MNLTKLTCTTRLLLVTIVGTSHLSDSLTIRNLWLDILDLDLLVVLHTPLQGTQVELTLTMNDNLAQLLRLLNNPCRILLTHLLQSGHHLLGLALVNGLDGTRELRVRILDEVELILYILTIKGVTSLNVLKLNGTTNITCYELINLNTVGTSASVDSTQTLLRTTIGIGEVVTTLYNTAHYLEVRYFANVWLNTCLEEIE